MATRSVASLAAFTARVFGITRSARANSAIASCSRELCYKVIKNSKFFQKQAVSFTHQRSSEAFEENGKRYFNSTTADDERLGLEDTLDDAESVVHRPLHLVTIEVVRAPKNDGRCRASFGSEK